MSKMKIEKLIIILLCASATLAVPFILAGNPYWLHIAITIGLNAILAMSMRLLMTTGLLNLALPSFVAVGSYTAATMLMRLNAPFLLTLISSGLMAAIVALILGYPFLRVKGVYFFLITLCLVELFRITISENWRGAFGGADGLYGIPAVSIGSFQFAGRVPYYYLCLALLLITILVLWRIEKSWIGKILYSMRDSDILCQSVGISIIKMRMFAFTIQCFIAGMAGAFYAVYLGTINPAMFGFDMAIYTQVYLIVGGMNSLWGPLLGAFLFGGLSDIFRGLGPYQMLIYGFTLIIIMKFLPGGLISLPERIVGVVNERYRLNRSERNVTA